MRTILLVSLVVVIGSFNPANEQPNEIIRRKIENGHLDGIQALGEPIYCEAAIKRFYQNRLFEVAWTSSIASQLLSVIQNADLDGLTPSDYHLTKLMEESIGSQKTALAKAEYDLLLTDAFLLFTSHLYSGKVNPQLIDAEWHVTLREGDPVALLAQAILSGDIAEATQSALPKHMVYQSLKTALKTYRAIEGETWQIIADGPLIKKGMEDERIPTIRERLFVLGDLKDLGGGYFMQYDENLYAAVQKFQSRNGLDNEGNIGIQTIAALNVSVKERINQIEANMERWRWLSREFGDYYINVNIANFELEVIKDGKLVRRHKVITGKPFRRTPVFSAKMQYLVFNPTWTVPPGILNADILPAVRKDTNYLAKKNFSVLDEQGNLVNTSDLDWNSNVVKSYTFRQAPGPENALGAVKFMFPNNFLVYLHDTPTKDLFEKTERAFSSGCIRVQQPLILAAYLLNDSVNWNQEKIDKIVATRVTQTVHLREQPNIYLLYWTAWTDTDNTVHFRKDIYERDRPLIRKLKEKPPMQAKN